MFFRPKKLYKYLSSDGAKKLFSSEDPTIWFRLPNRLDDIYDLRPCGSYADEFGGIGTFCLSETKDSAPMWAHYGSSGEGVVLEFSLQSKFFAANPPVKIRYQTKRPSIRSVREGLATKSAEWAYEREWRCFMTLPRSRTHEHKFLPSEQAISVPFPFEALTAIIHGYESCVAVGDFLARGDAVHVTQLVCRTNAWKYGFEVCAFDDLSHIFEHQEAARWGRSQRRR